MILEDWLKYKGNKFLLATKEKIYLGIGIKKQIKLENIDKYDDFIFIMKQFFDEDVKGIWKNFPTSGIIAQKIDIIKRKQCMEFNYSHNQLKYTITENYSKWKENFEKTMKEIKTQKIKKIVLSRKIKISLKSKLKEKQILKKLLENNSNSYIFFYKINNDYFFGASPECLVSQNKNKFTIDALAGTLKNSLENKNKILLDKKNQKEHQIVVDNIIKKIKPISQKIEISKQEILELNHIIHLKTKISIISNNSFSDFIKLLHPTPALGGFPQKKAIKFIKNTENYSRGLYGAPIGFKNKSNAIAIVAIRSALLIKNELHVFSGAGIIEESSCENEYQETTNKLKTILDIL